MARDLSDPFAELMRLKERVRVLETATPLQNASITRGRLRVAGGLLLIDDGGTLQVIGTVDGAGNFQWSGPWKFDSGDGEIAGDVDLTGDFDLTGVFTAGNVRIEDGKIYVGSGSNLIIIDGVTGKITAGNVTVEPNKITVGTGSTAATLQNGELTLSNGAKLAVGLTGGASSIGLLPGGSADISANTLTAWLRATGSTISVTTAQASISAPNIFMANLPSGAPAGAKAVLVDPSTGKLYRAA